MGFTANELLICCLQENAMTDAPPTEKIIRERSPSFPFIPLEGALGRLEEFERTFSRQEPPADRTYLAWGMKGDTSQAQQTLGALRAFGLVEYKGSGPKRLVTISADARNYLRAQQDSVKREAVKRLALKPKWIAHFWGIWGVDKVPDPIRLDALVLEHKFNESAAPTFLKVYDATIAYAGLRESDKDDGANVGSGPDDAEIVDVSVGDLVQVEIGGELKLPAPVRVRAIQQHEGKPWVYIDGSEAAVPMEQIRLEQKGAGVTAPPPLALAPADTSPIDRAVKAGWREERLIDDEGDETFLSYKGEPSVERYEFIRDYLEFRIGRLKKASS
jgi:hypothetical protein